jgi:hypothetical protein
LGVVRHLEQQAAEEPTVTATLLHSDAAVAADPPAAATPAQQPARIHLGRRPVQALDFDRMYRQLADFKRAHLTAHVPRHCWDAPELGAWVRQLRKLHKERRLERWKVDRWVLQRLGPWEVTVRFLDHSHAQPIHHLPVALPTATIPYCLWCVNVLQFKTPCACCWCPG